MSRTKYAYAAEDLILADEEGYWERHLTAQHPGNFFANLDPGAKINAPFAYCSCCIGLAAAALTLPVAA